MSCQNCAADVDAFGHLSVGVCRIKILPSTQWLPPTICRQVRDHQHLSLYMVQQCMPGLSPSAAVHSCLLTALADTDVVAVARLGGSIQIIDTAHGHILCTIPPALLQVQQPVSGQAQNISSAAAASKEARATREVKCLAFRHYSLSDNSRCDWWQAAGTGPSWWHSFVFQDMCGLSTGLYTMNLGPLSIQ
jgi:hypothetical protein